MQRFWLKEAFTGDAWREGVVVEVDAKGVIANVSNGAAPQDAICISAPVVPGLGNVHSHAFQRGMAGLTEHAGVGEDSFWTWRELMYRFLAALMPEDVENVAAMAYAEMLESGFTTVGEFHYLHHGLGGQPYAALGEMAQRIAGAASATGIGLVLLPAYYAYSNFGGTPAAEGQRRFLNTPDRFERLHEDSARAIATLGWSRIGIAPHSLRAVSLPDLLGLVARHAKGPIHIHVSEQVKEVEDCLAAHGKRPIELLFDTVAADRRWCLIHATHASAAERRRMVGAGVVAGLCPITEANLGDGIFDARDFVARGGRFAVGSDSNVDISAPGELRMLEYAQRLSLRRRNAIAPRGTSTGRHLFERALAGGAQALDLGPAGIVAGARADFVVLDPDHASFAARRSDRLLDSLVFAGARDAIREVWSLGRRVVADGRHVARDAISRRYHTTLARVIA